jgi:hypothetical protein
MIESLTSCSEFKLEGVKIVPEFEGLVRVKHPEK